MKDIRQGNDIKISWSIFKKDGQIFSLEGKNISLYLKSVFGRKELNDFVVTGNIIQWTFYGKDQKNTGKYSLEMVINEGEKGMITTDKCDFVNLVSCSCKLQGGEDAPNVETESIELTSTLEYVSGGGSYDDTALWKELENKVDKEEGKELSSNDYTDEDKAKVDGLEEELAKKVESEVVVDTESTEDFEFGYDDTKIRQEIAELSSKFSQLEQDIEVGKGIINFTNPVGPHCPDPCFWKADDGYFYIKGTGRISKVLRTRDFVNYEDTGRTFLSESALQWLNDNYGHPYNDGSILVPHCWAPFVIKIGNNWVLYMAVVERYETETEGVIEDGAAHIVAFTSRTPYGDFTNPVTIVSDGDFMLTNSVVWNNVIDPFVYCNPQDQKIYLVAGSSYSIGRLELTDDGLATVLEKGVGNKCLRTAGLTISSDPSREQVYEGAYIYSRPFNGKTYHYLFASKGHYAEDNYALVAFRCTDLNAKAGDSNTGWHDTYGTSPITKVETKQAINRVILRGASKHSTKPWGPGHCAGIFETADGKTWMLYHCHTKDGTNDRELFIQEVLWDKSGWPYFEGRKPVYSGKILNNIITDTPKVCSITKYV